VAWRIVIEGEGPTAPAIRAWIRSVNQGADPVVLAWKEEGLLAPLGAEDPTGVETDLLATIQDGD